MDGCAPGQGDPGNDKDTTMRKRVWHAFAVLSLFGCAAWADAPEPVLAWPGSQEPMREEALFVTDDHPRLQGLAPVVRRHGGWHALAGMTFSAWFMVPADDAPVTLARFTGWGAVSSGSEWSTGCSSDSLQSTMAVSCSGSVRAVSSHWGM